MSTGRRQVEVRGRAASYREAGSGIVAILAPGLALSSRFYERSYAPFAAAGIHLIVPDLPGWGETPGARTGLRPADCADFLLDFAAALDIRRAVWIGHSLGAQGIVHVAARRPDMTTAIVLVGPTGAPGRMEVLRQVWALAVEAGRTTPRVVGAVAREYFGTSPVRYVGTWLRHSRDDVLAELPRVRCRALILAGDADPVCRPRFVELLRQRMPHARVAWIRGGTHALPRAHADEFNRVVVDFVRGS